MPDGPRQQVENGLRYLTHGVPLAIALVTMLGGFMIAFTTLQVTQRALGGDLKTVHGIQDKFRPRIRNLESAQVGMQERLQAIQEEQRAATVRQAAGRLEVLDAIKDIGNRITNRP